MQFKLLHLHWDRPYFPKCRECTERRVCYSWELFKTTKPTWNCRDVVLEMQGKISKPIKPHTDHAQYPSPAHEVV